MGNTTKPQKPTFNEQIQQLRQEMTQLERREIHLEKKIAVLDISAKQKTQRNDNTGASYDLKKKKLLENQLSSIQAKKMDIETHITNIENEYLNQQTSKALRHSEDTLQNIQADEFIDGFDEIVNESPEERIKKAVANKPPSVQNYVIYKHKLKERLKHIPEEYHDVAMNLFKQKFKETGGMMNDETIGQIMADIEINMGVLVDDDEIIETHIDENDACDIYNPFDSISVQQFETQLQSMGYNTDQIIYALNIYETKYKKDNNSLIDNYVREEIIDLIEKRQIDDDKRQEIKHSNDDSMAQLRAEKLCQKQEEKKENVDVKFNAKEREFKIFYDQLDITNKNKKREYYNKFVEEGYNNIELMIHLDKNTLKDEIGLNSVHTNFVISKIESFKKQHEKFEIWLKDTLNMDEYFELFINEGILTFSIFYSRVKNVDDLLKIIGEQNKQDGNIIMGKLPKKNRMKSGQLDENNNDNIIYEQEGVQTEYH